MFVGVWVVPAGRDGGLVALQKFDAHGYVLRACPVLRLGEGPR